MPRTSAKAQPIPVGPPARRAPGRVPGWLIGVMCGAGLTLATGPTVLLAALLAPGLIALLVERTQGRPASRAMLLFGGCGCVGPVRDVWAGAGHGLGGTAGIGQGLGADTLGADTLGADTLAAAWLAALAGWLFHQLAPVLIGAVMHAAEARRVARLTAARARYEEEWPAPAE